ncbi:MAG: hypothetical protein AAGI90_07015, partial [Chlamydiota bacterium]
MSSLTSVPAAWHALHNCAPPVIFQSKGGFESSEEKGRFRAGAGPSEQRVFSTFKLHGNLPAIHATHELYKGLRYNRRRKISERFIESVDCAIKQLKKDLSRIVQGKEDLFCFFFITEGFIGKVPDFYAIARQHQNESSFITLIFTEKPSLQRNVSNKALEVLEKCFKILSLWKLCRKITASWCYTKIQPHVSDLIENNAKSYNIVSVGELMSDKAFQAELEKKNENGYHYALEKSYRKDQGASGSSTNLDRFLTMIRATDREKFFQQFTLVSISKFSEKNDDPFSSVFGIPYQNIPSQATTSLEILRFKEALLKVQEIYQNSIVTLTLTTDRLVITASRLKRESSGRIDEIIRDERGSQCPPDPSSLSKDGVKKQDENVGYFLLIEGALQQEKLRPKSFALL